MTNRFKVYAAGPMEGLSQEQMTGWRDDFKGLMSILEIDVLDPTRRQPFHEMDFNDPAAFQNACRMILSLDLHDIDNSDLVFFDLRRSEAKAWGTVMECMYAWLKRKPIVMWQNVGDQTHPFLESMYTVKVRSLEESAEVIKGFK